MHLPKMAPLKWGFKGSRDVKGVWVHGEIKWTWTLMGGTPHVILTNIEVVCALHLLCGALLGVHVWGG